MQRGGRSHPYRSRLRADSSFWLELQFCFENGIPHSQFLNWDPADKAKALAFALEKALRCPMCGTASWEWEMDRYAYEAVENLCQGCLRREAAQRNLHEDGRNADGWHIELVSTRTVEAAKRAERAKRIQRGGEDE